MLRRSTQMAAFGRFPFSTAASKPYPPKPTPLPPSAGSVSSALGQRSGTPAFCIPYHSLQALSKCSCGSRSRQRRLISARIQPVPRHGSGDGGLEGTGGGSSGGGGGNGGGGGGNGGNNDRFLFSWYLMALDKYPVATKSITSAVLTLIGDLICQLFINQVSKLDMRRTFVFTFLGLALVGPTLHVWYLYLSKIVKVKGASGAFVRLLLDQFVFSPIFIGGFMALLVTLEGKPSLVLPKLQQEWFSSVVANWQLWVPFQFLNFYFVPQKLQVLAANFVALAWNVILSFKAHKAVIMK